jgi:quercetin dioxygenase-like cupin family protein
MKRLACAALLAPLLWASGATATELNPAAVTFTLPDKINWKVNPTGADNAVLLGDPAKEGLYIVLVRWHAGHMSHPHFHPYDRFITVLSGTWWVGTGTKFDPDATVPMPAGTYVVHYGKQVHYDGAKDSDCVLEIVGEGPATATPAEEK